MEMISFNAFNEGTLLSSSASISFGGKNRTKGAFGGCLTLKLAVNAELLWGNCILAMKNRQKESGQTIGNRFETAGNYY